jgi:beta-glucosidase
LPHSPARLARVDLPPFVEAIAAPTDAVMSAHIVSGCMGTIESRPIIPHSLLGRLPTDDSPSRTV